MKKRASEVIRDALALSQINDSEAFDWQRKMSLLNASFVSLWDRVISSEDDFVQGQVELIGHLSPLPEDCYAVESVYGEGREYQRSDSRQGRLGSREYRIINNNIQWGGTETITLYYNKTPPTITFKREPVRLEGTSFASIPGVLCSTDLSDNSPVFTVTNLRNNATATYLPGYTEGGTFTPVIPTAFTLAFDATPVYTDAEGTLYYNEQIVAEGVVEFLANRDNLVEWVTQDGEHNVLTQDLLTIPASRPFGYLIGDNIYRYNNGNLEVADDAEDPESTFFPILPCSSALFADPYILYRDNRAWYYGLPGETGDVTISDLNNIPIQNVLTASWDDQTSWGVVYRIGSSYFLGSFYPDTVLDWPTNLYFDWLECAIAVDMLTQMQFDTKAFIAMRDERWSRLQSHIIRNRGDSYRLPKRYSKGMY